MKDEFSTDFMGEEFENLEKNDVDEERKRRSKRIEEMKLQKMKQERQRQLLYQWGRPAICVLALLVLVIFLGGKIFNNASKASAQKGQENVTDQELEIVVENLQQNANQDAFDKEGMPETDNVSGNDETQEQETVDTTEYYASENDTTKLLGEDIISSNAVLIDIDNHVILSEKAAKTKVSPASMTKVLTVLVAAEHVTNLDDTYTMNLDVTDFAFVNDCSTAGFLDGEVVTIRDLFYGTILPSGGEAAVALATYVAGSQEAFVQMMNDKLAELGISDTAHFTNCVGLYDENHYCSVYDMAIIMEAAVHNEFCKQVLSAHTYVTSITAEHPDGITISNWFLRRIEDKECGNMVLCGKTGYVVQSGSCAVSYAEDSSGKGYVCATANSNSSWRCIYDQVEIYKSVLK